MRIALTPFATGSGHNMRTLSLARQIRAVAPDAELTVLLTSLQATFTPMFEAAGVEVVSMADAPVDHSKDGHLDRELGWASYMGGYIAPVFLNGERILRYLAWYEQARPDLVVSDHDMIASAAAEMAGIPHVLVTERYDLTLCQLDDDTLRQGGFAVRAAELGQARTALHALFRWVAGTARLVLTDKPTVPEVDAGTPVAQALAEGRGEFVGPMIRDAPPPVPGAEVRRSLGLGPGPLLVASVSGTTMFVENKRRLIDTYLQAHRLLRRSHPDLQTVLLGRQDVEVPEGVHSLSYLPDWMPLLREADLLLSAPGWITVTEISALRVPALFVLSSLAEYHEVEALRRLDRLGFPTLVSPTAEALAGSVENVLAGASSARMAEAFSAVAPRGPGARRAAELIVAAARRATSSLTVTAPAD